MSFTVGRAAPVGECKDINGILLNYYVDMVL